MDDWNWKYKLISSIVILISVVSIAVIQFRKDDKRALELEQEYPVISTADQLDNLVLKKYRPPKSRYTSALVLVHLDDGRKCSIICELNETLHSKGINEILETGDRIVKRRNSDTILVVGSENIESEQYTFILFDE